MKAAVAPVQISKAVVEAQDLSHRHLQASARIEIGGYAYIGFIAAINIDKHHPHFVHVVFVYGERKSVRKGLSLPLDWPVEVTP